MANFGSRELRGGKNSMSDKKQVLIIDDNYETVDYLRSALELSRDSYHVTGVPSAEEGWLELLRQRVDLVIVDLRLPGMSGGELMHRIHRKFPGLPTIVMSGYSLEWMRQETAGLTVFRMLEKPLDTDQLLEVVDQAVFGRPAPVRQVENPSGFVDVNFSEPLRRRLAQLQQDTGARRLLMGTLHGQLLFRVGEPLGELDEERIAAMIAQNLRSSLDLAAAMGNEETQAIEVQMSDRFEIYMANAGRRFFIALYYPVQSQRARIGTIWVFLQRALRDLVPLLPAVPEDGPQAVVEPDAPGPVSLAAAAQPAAVLEPEPEPEPEAAPEAAGESPAASPPLSLEEALAQGLLPNELSAAFAGITDEEGAPAEEPLLDLSGSDGGEEDLEDFLDLLTEHEADPSEADAFWRGIVTGDTEKEVDDADLDEAIQTGILVSSRLEEGGTAEPAAAADPEQLGDDELEALSDLNLLDLDAGDEEEILAFWDAALGEDDPDRSSGLSFEEARRKGLLGNDEDGPSES